MVVLRIRDAQKIMQDFERARMWTAFSDSQIFTHLVEEVAEIGRHILSKEGYKVRGLGHEAAEGEASSEFAQAFSLLLQLANRLGVDLEEAFVRELEIMERRFDPERWRRYLGGEESRV